MGFGQDFLRGAGTFLDPRAMQLAERQRLQEQALADRNTAAGRNSQLAEDKFNAELLLNNVAPEDRVAFADQNGLERFNQDVQTPFKADTFPGEPNLGGLSNVNRESFFGKQKRVASQKNMSNLGKMRNELAIAQQNLDSQPQDERLQAQVKSAQAGVDKATQITRLFESSSKREFTKLVSKNRNAADSARKGIITANNALKLLGKGINTGFFANVKTTLQRVAKASGIEIDKSLTNTEQFKAVMGQATLNILGSGVVGAGTGISDKDVEFVQGVVAGDITLGENTIKEVLRINAVANQFIIDEHNKLTEFDSGLKSFRIDSPKFKGSKKTDIIDPTINNNALNQKQEPSSGKLILQNGNLFDSNGNFVRKAN